MFYEEVIVQTINRGDGGDIKVIPVQLPHTLGVGILKLNSIETVSIKLIKT